MFTIQPSHTDRNLRGRPRVVFVPISVAWAFTPDRGWHVIEDPTSVVDMDRLCDRYDELERDPDRGTEWERGRHIVTPVTRAELQAAGR